MTRRIDMNTARTEFDDILKSASRDNARFVVEQKGEPAVVIMSMRDFLISRPAPEWLEKSWARAAASGLDKMTMDEIDAEIAETRRELAASAAPKT